MRERVGRDAGLDIVVEDRHLVAVHLSDQGNRCSPSSRRLSPGNGTIPASKTINLTGSSAQTKGAVKPARNWARRMSSVVSLSPWTRP
jgi:hypothetical protein